MNSDEKRMILVNGLYPFCSSLAAVFLNVYLYAYTKSLLSMAGFTFVRVMAIPVFFTIGGRFSSRLSWPWIISLGLGFMIAELVFVLSVRDGFAIMPWLVLVPAFLYGSREGLFWLGVNTLNQLVTDNTSVMQFLSWTGILGIS
ncbi:MAG: hypothetical protein VZT48_08620 [Bulleidia sp.]|nr:hypothetical protein [Bulleidia sp.]